MAIDITTRLFVDDQDLNVSALSDQTISVTKPVCVISNAVITSTSVHTFSFAGIVDSVGSTTFAWELRNASNALISSGSGVGISTFQYDMIAQPTGTYSVRLTVTQSNGLQSSQRVKSFSWTAPTGGNTYYFSQAGNDTTGDGSQSTPWQTLAKLSSLTLLPGDVVRLNRGDTWTENVTINGSGSASTTTTIEYNVQGTDYDFTIMDTASSNRIYIADYGSGDKPLIDGNITATNRSHIMFENIQTDGTATFTNCNNIIIFGVDMTSTTGDTIVFTGGSKLWVKGGIITNFAETAIQINGSATNKIQEVVVEDLQLTQSTQNTGSHNVINIVEDSGNDLTGHMVFRRNYFYNTGGHAFNIETGTRYQLEDNFTENCYSSAARILASDVQLERSWHKNASVDASSPTINIQSNTWFVSNIITGDTYDCLTFSSATNARVWFNTISPASGSTGDFITISDTSTVEIQNNIFDFSRDTLKFNINFTNVTMDYNLYYTSSTSQQISGSNTFTAFQTGAIEPNGFESNPTFSDSARSSEGHFTISGSSTANNQGTSVSYTLDYNGDSRAAIPDIGAYEVSCDRCGSSSPAAFEGATGYGACTRHIYAITGTPTVYTVTSTNPVSTIQSALAASGPRYLVFETSGLFDLGYVETMNPYLYIAGETAPGPVIFKADWWHEDYGGSTMNNMVIRHITFMRDSTSTGDTFSAKSLANCVIDSCAFLFGRDECFDLVSGGNNITVQNSIFAYGISGAEDAKGISIADSNNISFHGNLIAHNEQRAPLAWGGRQQWKKNVFYNMNRFSQFGSSGAGTSQEAEVDMFYNTYKTGPMGALWEARPILGRDSDSSPDWQNTEKFNLHSNSLNGVTYSPGTDAIDEASGATITDSITPLSNSAACFSSDSMNSKTVSQILSNVGPHPNARLSLLQTIIDNYNAGTGISSPITSAADVGGVPNPTPINRSLTIPSNPHTDSGNGYTNLEVWLKGYHDGLQN